MQIVNDRQLKSYFLGDLAAEEAERLEEKCASDAELSERAHIVEAELADDYLREKLSAAERRRFEENYLTTEARWEKLRAAEYLWKIAAENQAPPVISAASLWQTLFGSRRLLTFGGLAAAAIICGGFFLIWLNFTEEPEIAKQENAAQSSNSGTVNHSGANNQNAEVIVENLNSNADSLDYNSQKNANKISPKPTVAAPEIKPTPKSSAPALIVFTLSPGTLRSGEGEQFIKIPPQTGKINLRLKLPNDAPAYKNYRAVIQTGDGEVVFTAPNLKSLSISLPARKLENQTYLVFLQGQNAPDKPAESVAEYTFQVRR